MSLGVTRALPTPAELRARLNYDPATGALAWKARVGPDVQYWNARYAGVRAGSVNSAHGFDKTGEVRSLLSGTRTCVQAGDSQTQEIAHLAAPRGDVPTAFTDSRCTYPVCDCMVNLHTMEGCAFPAAGVPPSDGGQQG